MNKTNLKSHLGIGIMLGSIWGFAEVALGLGLRSCAALVSGSLMTGVALFFICASWVSTRRFYVPVLIVIIACLFKLFDALLLNLPVIHGAVANPMFAFLMEGFAFLILVAVFLTATASFAADVEHGKKLYSERCGGCHDTKVHTRPNRIVHTYEDLVNRIRFCDTAAKANFSESDIFNVADYLNDTFYKFIKVKE